MAPRIEQLTPEQVARFPECVARWTEIGLSTAPADRPRAEAGIRQSYATAGLRAPRIVWTGSPLSQSLTRGLVLASVRDSVGASVWDSVRDFVGASVWDSVRASVRASVAASVWDSVGASVRDSVRDFVWASVWDSVGASVRASVADSVWDSVGASVGASVRASAADSVWDSVWASVRASVRDSVGASVAASVWDSVWASVWDSVRDFVWASVWDSIYGQDDAAWIALYAYFREILGLVAQTDALAGIREVTESAGWWLPHARICWVSERHNGLARDERGRLHSATGPALTYPDGWAIYAWHGVRVPAWIIDEPVAALTRERILGLPNAEQRRVLLERIGTEAFLGIVQPTVLHKDTAGNGQPRQLVAVDMPNDPDGRLVAVQLTCPSTGRRYLLRVPPDIRDCQTAVAWTFGLEARQYEPLTET